MAFTDEQNQAIYAREPLVCVSAGAGSGKTTILIERIADLLARHKTESGPQLGLDQIVAITFTEKAAAEMKARLRRKFREAADPANAGDMHFWREMERQVESARVSTIHSFCASILREHALRIGMDPDWGVLGDAESEQLAENVVTETIYRLLEKEDPACLRVSLEFSRAQLKEALLDMLMKRWEYQAVDGETRYASPEALYQYWEEGLPGAQEALLRTYCHNPEVRVLEDALRAYDGHCSDAGDKRELQRCACIAVLQALINREDDLAGKIRGYFSAYPRMGGQKDNWSSEDAYIGVKDALTRAKNFMKDNCLLPAWDEAFERRAAQITCDFFQVGNQVMTAYRAARQAGAVLDFEDMINETLALLRNHPDICRRVAGSIRYLLIDEFQDTDKRQLEIAQLLASAAGGPHLFVVGDVKQSIYYFRGAEVSIFSTVRKQSANPLTLPDNFRSVPEVLHFVNDFFERTQLLGAVEAYQPMGVHREARRTPCVECFIPQPGGKELAAEMHERDAEFIAQRILELCGGDAPLLLQGEGKGGTRAASYDDGGLLFRRSSYMEDYESALRQKNIPYNRISGAGFFQRREIEDILALLKLILDPWDEEAMVTVLRSPLVGLSDESLMRMVLMEDGLAAAFHSDAIPELFEQTDMLERARRLFAVLYEQRESEPGNLLRQILEYTGYEAVLLSQHLGLQHVANLRKAIQMADGFAHSRPATLAEFTHYLEDVAFRELKEGDSTLQSKGMGAVTLMTIHKAKGLEFPIVFIPEMFAGDSNTYHSLLCHHAHFGMVAKVTNEDGELKANSFFEVVKRFRQHEERMERARVLYVAMTRARDYLVLCGYPTPPRYSWADSLNLAYELPQRSHAEVIDQGGWQMRVQRELPGVTVPYLRKQPSVVLDTEKVARRIGPITDARADVRVVSVTRLLSRIAGVDEFEDEYRDGQERNTSGELPDANPLNRRFSLGRGTLVHRMFELWDFGTDKLPDVDLLVQDAGLGMEQSVILRETLVRMADRFRASELWPLVSSAVTVEKEIPFLLDIGPALIRGVMDAVVDDTVIIDYKTGAPDPARQHHYEMQLHLYAAAFQSLKGTPPVRGVLWYADHGSAHTIQFTEKDISETLVIAAESCIPL